jgi:hypothetical protein
MHAPRQVGQLFRRTASAAKRIAALFGAGGALEPTPAMIGTPPSARRLPAIPADPTQHAREFATEYGDRLEHYFEGRMHALGIPAEQMGASDPDHGVPWRVFFPHEIIGGSVVSGGRIYVDSGALNLDLLTTHPRQRAAIAWAKGRPRDRIDAVIAHELTESQTGSHADAEARALTRLSRSAKEPGAYCGHWLAGTTRWRDRTCSTT